jgi:hypothetical protein
VENCQAPCAGAGPSADAGGAGACSIVAGGGTVVADVTFPGTIVTEAMVVSSVDGVEQGAPVRVNLSQQTYDDSGGPVSKGVVVLSVPAAGTTWTLTAQAASWESPPVSLTLTQPNLVVSPSGSLAQQGCSPSGQLCLGLGPASIGLQLGGYTTAQDLSLFWYQNGIAVGDPQRVALVQQAEACSIAGTVPVAIPATAGQWQLWGQFGAAAPEPLVPSVTVQDPPITVQLDCGGVWTTGSSPDVGGCSAVAVKCGATAGGTANLVITVPSAWQAPATVTVSTVVAGASTALPDATLGPASQGSQLQTQVSIPVPASGYWEVDANVGGYTVRSCFTL